MGAIIPTAYDIDKPWERQPCDTEARWRAFHAYRDQEPPRSLRALCTLLGLSHVAGRNRFSTWSTEDGWPERCFAYDRYLDARRVELIVDVLAEDAREVANRHAGIARDAIECAHSVVRGWLVRLQANEPLEGWTPTEVRGMLKDMVTLERLVRGEATERVDHSIGFDLSRLSVDEIEIMRLLEEKAGVVE